MSLTKEQQEIISQGIAILTTVYQRENLMASNPQQVKAFCQLQLAALEHEVFGVLFLDSQHRLMVFSEMFRGTIDSASVYPREVAKAALQINAAAVIFAHNHPSGMPEPSQADIRITERLVEALKLLDIRVLDHIVVGGGDSVSFAERGLI